MAIPALVGTSSTTANGGIEITSLPYPPGALSGDFAVLALIGGWSPGLADCADPRMTAINIDDFNGRKAKILVGIVSDPATPLAIDLMGTSGSPIGQFAAAACSVFRRMRWQPSRGVVNSSQFGDTGIAPTSTLPELPGSGSGSLCVFMAAAGFSGTRNPDWAQTGDVYAGISEAGIGDSYIDIALGISTLAPTPSVPTPNTYGDQAWRTTTFGFTSLLVAPPCRIYPREDQLGLGSGRIYPPPRSHQASSRRGGGSHY